MGTLITLLVDSQVCCSILKASSLCVCECLQSVLGMPGRTLCLAVAGRLGRLLRRRREHIEVDDAHARGALACQVHRRAARLGDDDAVEGLPPRGTALSVVGLANVFTQSLAGC